MDKSEWCFSLSLSLSLSLFLSFFRSLSLYVHSLVCV